MIAQVIFDTQLWPAVGVSIGEALASGVDRALLDVDDREPPTTRRRERLREHQRVVSVEAIGHAQAQS